MSPPTSRPAPAAANLFPPKAALAHPKAGTAIAPSTIPSVSKYAAQQLLTGEQAKVYANDFIAVALASERRSADVGMLRVKPVRTRADNDSHAAGAGDDVE